MSSLDLIYEGEVFKAYCLNTGQDCDFNSMFGKLDTKLQKKVLRRIQYLADNGPLYKDEIYKEISQGIYEIKVDALRSVLVYHAKMRRVFVITHMFVKKRNKWPKSEIERALVRKNMINSIIL